MGLIKLHVMVADVIKSFDTVDSILDCALGRLGLPAWFRKVYFSFHSQVRLRFKLATGLGESWCRDGGIPQGCPLSVVFIVALYVPLCRRLEAMPAVRPQLYADNLKCTVEMPSFSFLCLQVHCSVCTGCWAGCLSWKVRSSWHFQSNS